MNAQDAGRIDQVLEPLLAGLSVLEALARRLHPPALPALVAQTAQTEAGLIDSRAARDLWPEPLAPLGAQLDLAGDELIAAFEGLRSAVNAPESIGQAYRALRHLPRALEAIYPLAGLLAPVNRYFLDESVRDDPDLCAALMRNRSDEVGVMAFGEAPGERSGVWMYVPETYTAEHAHPLIMALHGGSGRGRGFLWSWLRTARSRGAILVAPTSLGPTWALMDEDIDSPHLARILAFVQSRWHIDASRQLLTGMSDGGTFSYVSGLTIDSPFTHLAPACAAFHPMLAQMAPVGRLRDLPIHIIHGQRDWMFPVTMAQEAAQALQAAGARVCYRELADLSHVYPAELNAEIMNWMDATPVR